jgi:hypothetical protein
MTPVSTHPGPRQFPLHPYRVTKIGDGRWSGRRVCARRANDDETTRLFAPGRAAIPIASLQLTTKA